MAKDYRLEELDLSRFVEDGALSSEFSVLHQGWVERGIVRWFDLLTSPQHPVRLWGAFRSDSDVEELAALTVAIGQPTKVAGFDVLYEAPTATGPAVLSPAIWYFVAVTVGEAHRGLGVGRALIRSAAADLWASDDEVEVKTLSPAVGLEERLGVKVAVETTPGLQVATTQLPISRFHEGNGAHLEELLLQSRMDDTESCCASLVFAYVRPTDAAQRGQSEMDLSGSLFAERYQIQRVIGQGGMGAVYRARDIKMNREVALKVLREYHAETEDGVAQFIQEAKNSSKLKHPNSIRVFDFGRTETGFLYLAMELLEGAELTELIATRRPIPPLEVIQLAQQICKSVGEAHSLGLVHRDLKPANIFLCQLYGEHDFVKVLDFGISQFIWEATEVERSDGYIAGTASYIAPEQALQKEQGPAVDVYSLGVILYEMLSGEPPFTGTTPMAIAMQHVGTDLPEFSPELNIPEALAALVYQMLAKSPDARPDSIEQVGEALATLRHSLTGMSAAPGAPDQSPPRDSSSGAARGAVLPVLLFFLVGLVAWVWSTSRPAPEPVVSSVPNEAAGPGGLDDATEVSSVDQPQTTPMAQPIVTEVEKPSKPVPLHQTIRVLTTPSVARVFEGERDLGVTPLDLAWDRTALRTFSLRAEGYDPADLVLDPSADDRREEVEVVLQPSAPPKRVKKKRLKPRRKKANRWRDFEE